MDNIEELLDTKECDDCGDSELNTRLTFDKSSGSYLCDNCLNFSKKLFKKYKINLKEDQ